MLGGSPVQQVPPVDLDKGGRIPQVVYTAQGPSLGWLPTDLPTSIEYVIDGNGQALGTGYKGFLVIPIWAIINDWILGADTVCTASVDVWKCTQAQYPPTVANSICGGNLPALANANFAKGVTLTGWNTEINQGDVVGFNVSSISAGAPTRLTIILECVRILGRPG